MATKKQKKMIKVHPTEKHFRVRVRHPSGFKKTRTPKWAAAMANGESKGAQVVMGQNNAGNWKVQSILIKKGHGKRAPDARRLATRIRDKVEK